MTAQDVTPAAIAAQIAQLPLPLQQHLQQHIAELSQHQENPAPPEHQGQDWESYVRETAALVGLDIPPEVFPQVVENFVQIVAIAQPLLTFPLGDEWEAAPVFRP